jgi:serine O-acetyltransferase
MKFAHACSHAELKRHYDKVLGVSTEETARPRAVRCGGMSWLQLYRSDMARYKQYAPGVSSLNLLFTNQGLWALLEHRIASGVNNAALPPVIKRPCLYALEIWQKAVEILAGISISCEACIGPGFYIGHFGSIFIGRDAIIGRHCSISHGVAIGESGRGTQRGTPRLGDRVLIGANAVLAGKLSVGDDAVIAPNSLVIYDVSESSVMMGVPARCFSKAGSRDIVPPEIDYPIIRSGESRASR